MNTPGGAPEERFRIAQIVWAAMLGAVVVYWAVGTVMAGRSGGDVAPPMLREVLLGIAGASTMAVWFLRGRFLAPLGERPTAQPGATAQRSFTVLVVCWALGESIALYGLVLAMLDRPDPLFFLWGLALLVVLRPRAAYFPASTSSQPR